MCYQNIGEIKSYVLEAKTETTKIALCVEEGDTPLPLNSILTMHHHRWCDSDIRLVVSLRQIVYLACMC